MINPRLFERYNIDTTKDLKIERRCSRPYDTILIDKKGSCYACECTSWLPQSIGNLQIRSLEEIIGSDMHRHLQGSVTDGTYRYCNQQQCSYLKSGKGFHGQSYHIQHLRLAIDDSCNLRCPSCRTKMIFHKDGSAYNLGIRLADSVNDWLHRYQRPMQVHMGSDGDPFASHVYRHFMEHTPLRDNIKYSILTNGLMFKEFHTKVPNVTRNLDTLGISIDGASRDTYEKLRLGGKWDKILEALQCISDLKSKQDLEFTLHMVVQQDNWREMESMLALAHRYNVDTVYFNKIEDWGTNVDTKSQTFTESDEFKETMWRVSTDPVAWNNVASLV